MEVVVFELTHTRIAIDRSAVREILALGSVTPVPLAPASVAGVVHVKGQIVPVVDMGSLFDVSAGAPRAGDRGVLVEAESCQVILYAEKISDEQNNADRVDADDIGAERIGGNPVGADRDGAGQRGAPRLVDVAALVRRVTDDVVETTERLGFFSERDDLVPR